MDLHFVVTEFAILSAVGVSLLAAQKLRQFYAQGQSRLQQSSQDCSPSAASMNKISSSARKDFAIATFAFM